MEQALSLVLSALALCIVLYGTLEMLVVTGQLRRQARRRALEEAASTLESLLGDLNRRPDIEDWLNISAAIVRALKDKG